MEYPIALIALIISILSLGMSFYFWRRQFRPIITVAVRTVRGGNCTIAYSLNVKNSGSIPAKNIHISLDESTLEYALGKDATGENRVRWLRSINENSVHMLQNGDTSTCSFGTSQADDNGFWKYGSEITIKLEYTGWFGYKYTDAQVLKIQDSDSFTGYMWGANKRMGSVVDY